MLVSITELSRSGLYHLQITQEYSIMVHSGLCISHNIYVYARILMLFGLPIKI